MLGVLIALLLTISAAVYMYVIRFELVASPAAPGAQDPSADARRLARLSVLLTILLISALLVLLFVLGCYLLIRAGRFVREPIAGKPTDYMDVWQDYRLTDDQIAAATAESADDFPDQHAPGDNEDNPSTPES
jgi:hypothetical protein